MKYSKIAYNPPCKIAAKTNMSWQEYAKKSNIKTKEFIAYLEGINFITRVPLPKQKFTRIEPNIVPELKGYTETFFINNGKGHYSQGKLTPKGIKHLEITYKRDIAKLKKGICAKDVLEQSLYKIYRKV